MEATVHDHLSRGYRRVEPISLPEPYDNIGRMRRAEILYYFEIDRDQIVAFSYAGKGFANWPDAVFPLEGLDDLLRVRRDPCSWRAS